MKREWKIIASFPEQRLLSFLFKGKSRQELDLKGKEIKPRIAERRKMICGPVLRTTTSPII
jgi:hypothetical protein